MKELRAALDKDPFNINLRLMLAAALENSGKNIDAVKVLQDTIEKARRNLGVTYCTLGSSLMKAEKPDEALPQFDRAIEVDPSNSSFYLSNKAAALNKIGLADKAKALYQDLLSRTDLAKETRRIVNSNLKDIR
ncbi:MAG TPA: hypothetical protein VFC86_09750 [Planctomycetota bacterium]|nr:hypothetical protein [Planctomycetota bacterium]